MGKIKPGTFTLRHQHVGSESEVAGTQLYF